MSMTNQIQQTDSVQTLTNATPSALIYAIDSLKAKGFHVISNETYVMHTATGPVNTTHIYYREVKSI